MLAVPARQEGLCRLTPPSSGRPKGRFAPFAPPLMSNVRYPMKLLRSALLPLIAGCVLWWLGVYLSGFLSAQSWPEFVVALSKSNKLQALYFWQVTVHFLPMFFAVGVAGYALFRMVGSSAISLVAVVLPYVAFNWLMGSLEILFRWSALTTYGLTVIALSAFPLGLLAAWWLARHGHLTTPSSGRPPAGFAV